MGEISSSENENKTKKRNRLSTNLSSLKSLDFFWLVFTEKNLSNTDNQNRVSSMGQKLGVIPSKWMTDETGMTKTKQRTLKPRRTPSRVCVSFPKKPQRCCQQFGMWGGALTEALQSQQLEQLGLTTRAAGSEGICAPLAPELPSK